MSCPVCQAAAVPGHQFCGQCGASLARACAACGTENPVSHRFCGQCGLVLDAAPQAPHSRPPVTGGEERRVVSVLFADLVGFTALSERLDSEEVREITTECFRRLVAEVLRYGGTVDKFIGDAVMALFGAPVAHEDDPDRALLAALAMQEALAAFNEELEQERHLRLGMRIGIESGEVIAGLREIGGFREYTVIGDAVNVASRLQAAAEPGGILVGASTQQRLRAGFALRPIPPLNMKGKEQPVAASVLVAAGVTAASEMPRAPLVGRDGELAALRECLVALDRGEGRLATVLGEPGLGKSRLLAELRHDELAAGITWVRGQAFAHEQALSYGLTRKFVRGLCGVTAEADAAAQQLRTGLGLLGCPDHFPALAHMLMLPLTPDGAQRMAGLSPQELQQLTLVTVADLLRRTTVAVPLVLELDDLHWADPSSVELLQQLLDLVEDAPICVFCAMRPEPQTPAWALRAQAASALADRCREVWLQPLSEEASAELVGRLLRSETLPAGLEDLLERAAGTPLWVEELVRTLIERGLLIAENGNWRVTAALGRVELPTTLQALIVARLDRLGDLRATLQTASVIGRRFPWRVLARVAGGETPVELHLRQAIEADLVREVETSPEREYTFKHVLIQEATYGTLLVRRRRELHGRVAEALEELYPERVNESHALLARHYQQAERWPQALAHAERAGVAAQAAYANREALEHYTLALAAAEAAMAGPETRLRLHTARATSHDILGEFDQARADFEAAQGLARNAGDRRAEWQVLVDLGLLWAARDYARTGEYCRRALELAREMGEPTLVAHSLNRLGNWHINADEAPAALSRHEEALAIVQGLDDPAGLATTLDLLGMASINAGDATRSVAYYGRAIELFRELDDRRGLVSALATLLVSDGTYEAEPLAVVADAESSHNAELALQIACEIGQRSGEAYVLFQWSSSLGARGEYGRALSLARQCLQVAGEIEHGLWSTTGHLTLGLLHLDLLAQPAAREHLERALQLAQRVGSLLFARMVAGALATTYTRQGELSQARTLLATLLDTNTPKATMAQRNCWLASAELTLAGGDAAGALEIVDQLYASAANVAGNGHAAIPRLALVRGACLAALGRETEAEAAWQAARTGAAARGRRPVVWRAQAALGKLYLAQGRRDKADEETAAARSIIEDLAASLPEGTLRETFRHEAFALLP